MIESFTITNHLGESLVLELSSPEKSGLVVESVTGLGQVNSDVNLTKLAGSDYSVKNSAFLKDRNIVFKLKYYGDDIENSRHTADKFFPTEKTISIVIKTDYRELITSGIVEKNEPDIFSKNSGCQISILCPDPFWYSMSPVIIPFGGIEPKFEFPFPNEGNIVDSDGWDTFEFGNIRISKEKTIYYTGEAETGITIQVDAIGPVRDLTFYDINDYQRIKLDDTIIASITGGTSIMAGDKIIISTSKTQKYATLIRSGVTYNIINALGMPVQWFELNRGDNVFSYSASEGEYDMIINIKHRVAYKGA